MLSRSAGSEQADESVELRFLMQHQTQPLLQRAWIMLQIERGVAPHPGDSDYGVSLLLHASLASKDTIIKYKYNNKLTQEHSLKPIMHNQPLNLFVSPFPFVCLNTFKKCQPSYPRFKL